MTDTWHLLLFHSLFPPHVSQLYNDGQMPLRSFAGVLSAELLQMADAEDAKLRMLQKRALSFDTSSGEDEEQDMDMDMDIDDGNIVNGSVNAVISNYYYMTNNGKRIDNCKRIDTKIDGNGNLHTLARFPVVQTGQKQKRRALVQKCNTCGKDSTMFCFECGICYCHSKGNSGHGRKCFQHHVPSRRGRNIHTSI